MRKFGQIARAKLMAMVAQALPIPVAIDKTFIKPRAVIYKAQECARCGWLGAVWPFG